jgi:glyoxylase-like metal-dependent hydrolase (beta-lactamase superfamily II)
MLAAITKKMQWKWNEKDIMEIKIFPIHMGLDTIYIVSGEGTILIDGGDPNKIAKFIEGIEKASIKPEDIRLIVLTHGHWDHIGSARDIKELTGAKILLHRRDMHFLDDTHPSQPPGLTPWGKIVIAVLKLYTRFVHIPPFGVDIVAGDEIISLAEYGIAGKVVHTPGHSWGSVSVLLDSGEAFVGDLGMNMIPLRFTPGLPIFGDEMPIIKNSWQNLFGMGIKTVYPAHGAPFPAEILSKRIGFLRF